MKLLIKITVSLIVGALIGLFYVYEHPNYEYYKKSTNKYQKITLEAYQDLKTFNKEIAKFNTEYTIPLIRKDVFSRNKFLVISGMSFIGMMLIMNLFQSLEYRLKKFGND